MADLPEPGIFGPLSKKLGQYQEAEPTGQDYPSKSTSDRVSRRWPPALAASRIGSLPHWQPPALTASRIDSLPQLVCNESCPSKSPSATSGPALCLGFINKSS